jgi:hypothetical protein
MVGFAVPKNAKQEIEGELGVPSQT